MAIQYPPDQGTRDTVSSQILNFEMWGTYIDKGGVVKTFLNGAWVPKTQMLSVDGVVTAAPVQNLIRTPWDLL